MKNNKLHKLNNFLKNYLKQITNLMLSIFAYIIYYTTAFLLPLPVASSLGYIIGRFILYPLPFQRKKEVLKNIALAFPQKSNLEIKEIYKKSCINFLQTIFELPKFNSILKNNKYITIKDDYNLLEYSLNNSLLLFSAHTGNWEFGASYTYTQNPNSYLIYKAPHNVFVEKLFLKMRSIKSSNSHLITLNTQSILTIRDAIKNNKSSLGMLVDQRIKEGLNVKLFNRPAKTSQLLPLLAIKYNVLLGSMRVIRVNFCKFVIEIDKPLEIDAKYYEKQNQNEGIAILTQLMNDRLESWIKEYPNQWFWLHRRW